MGKDQELLEAARSGNIQVVEKILGQRAKRSGPLASLRRGPGANVQDASGYSALHHAALNGHQEIVQLLLSHEASTNIVDDKGCSPLHLAAWTGNVHTVRLLLSQGPSVPNVNLMNMNKETALHCSAQYGHTGVVNLLLEHGCDPTIRNIRQETALDLAAQYGRLETVETLVRTHPELVAAYTNRSDSTQTIPSYPHTPLHLASRNGHKGVVEVLLSAGHEVNVRTLSGTPLHEAALCGKTEVVKTLLDNGADLSIRDVHNNTVIDLLQQFPPHVVQDITSLIKRHRTNDKRDCEESLPPIPVSSLGSPYENVRMTGRHSPTPSSPTVWTEIRRVSQSSAISQDSEMCSRSVDSRQQWNSSALSKSMMEGSFLSEDSCGSHTRDPDQISVSSTSSIGGPTSKDRRSADIYLPMTPSPGSNNKVSPTPPKKPPRRNLSVSPTHLTPSGMGAYEYLFMARSGVRSHGDLDDINVGNRPHREMLRRGKSADQYVDMKLRYSIMGEEFSTEDSDPKFQPIAITSVYENIPFRTTNPKRKLRRLQTDKSYENYDPAVILSRGDLPFKKVETCSVTSMSHVQIVNAPGDYPLDRRKVSCPLSPTNYQQPPTPDHPPPSASQAELSIHERIRPLSQSFRELAQLLFDLSLDKRAGRMDGTGSWDEVFSGLEECGDMLQKLVCLSSPRSDSPESWLQANSTSLHDSEHQHEYCKLMKRRSRDMETETEEELLLLVYPSPNQSPADYVIEEFVGDAPFAGLMKGSITSENKAERPKTLRKLRNVYENVKMAEGEEAMDEGKVPDKGVLSPFDEQEEWAKITEIMASFGTLVRESVFISELEKEFQERLGLNLSDSSSSVGNGTCQITQWLTSINLPQYQPNFINFGYDNINFINGVLDDSDLKEMGITSEEERKTILEASKSLKNKVSELLSQSVNNNNKNEEANKESVEDWLEKLDLSSYWETFRKHLYTDMDRVKSVWEVELTAVLEISKPGHRHRIVASLPRSSNQPSIQDINAELSQIKSSMADLETKVVGTGTLRHSHKKNRPAPPPPGKAQPELQIRDPSQLLVGVPSTITAQWRHQPHALLSGALTYHARYLGSTVVKVLRGAESTKKSIQKLKKPLSEQSSAPDIYLAISYHGVKFLSGDTKELVCEHEIRNIHLACQDAEDLTHFAYITKDRATKSHYCHVFSVQTMDQATEVILTLGQAFEVAYQMALREANSTKGNGHSRSFSANLAPVTSQPNHNRSHSVNEIKLNGEAMANGHTASPVLITEEI